MHANLYEGQTYDADTNTVSGTVVSGNPISYYNGTRWEFDWSDGRKLISAESDDYTLSFEYDQAGIRTTKTVDGVVHEYIYASGRLMRETITENGTTIVLDFIYDQNGRPYAMIHDDGEAKTTCYYILSLQGDVVRLVDEDGETIQNYKYNAWGEPIGTVTTEVGKANPLRYRGYCYDAELGMYYLQSRYYDPQIGRFINADSYASTGQGFLGYNMFAYCGNRPISRIEVNGNAFEIAFDIFTIGLGIADVCENPDDKGAWAGLCADLVDLLPFEPGWVKVFEPGGRC